MIEIIISAVLAFNAETNSSLSPNLFVAIAKVESDFNCKAKSNKGALGLMQIMPINWEQYGRGDWQDPVENTKAACRLWCSMKYTNDLFLGLCEYYAGQKFVDTQLACGQNPDFGKVADYAYKVLETIE